MGGMSQPTPGDVLDLVQEATRRLVRAVDAMTDAEWTAPSVLPGWSRAHVVAHLTLNAEGLAAVAVGARQGEPVALYPSDADRDADIETLAAQGPSEQRERLLAATTVWFEATTALPPGVEAAEVERTPGGARFTVGELPLMRWREVEIHHSDLGLDYGPTDWPAAFVGYLLPVLAWDRGAQHDLLLRTPDGDLPVGRGAGPEGGAVVEGPPADLAWWLLGRGDGAGLTGDLPALGPWTRRPPPP
jgi:maleylpyruvate isomerase